MTETNEGAKPKAYSKKGTIAMARLIKRYYEAKKDNRTVGLNVRINDDEGAIKECGLNIILLIDDNLFLSIICKNNHSILMDDKSIKTVDFSLFMNSIRGVSELTEAFLNNQSIKEALRELYHSEGFSEVISPQIFTLCNYGDTVLSTDCFKTVLRLKKQSILPAISRLIEGKELDITRYQITVGSTIDDLSNILGLRQSSSIFDEYSFLSLIWDGNTMHNMDCIPISKGAVRRKRQTDNYFAIEPNIKKTFSIKYAKRLLMKCESLVEAVIDSDYHIVDVRVLDAPKEDEYPYY